MLPKQNVKLALKLAQRGYVLEFGTVKLSGSGEQLDQDKRVSELYLGRD